MDERFGVMANSVKGIFKVADQLLGHDDPFTQRLKPDTSTDADASEPPTALEEIGQGFRYVGRQARRKLRDMRDKAGEQTRSTDAVGNRSPRDAKTQDPSPSPTSTDVAVCTEHEGSVDDDGWIHVSSGAESDVDYDPSEYRPLRPPGPIMQTVNSAMNHAANMNPSAVGDAIYSGIARPFYTVRPRSNTSEDQLADEHAWMKTKLPSQSYCKKLATKPTSVKRIGPGDEHSLSLCAHDPTSSVSPEAAYNDAVHLPGVKMGSLETPKAASSIGIPVCNTAIKTSRNAPKGNDRDELIFVSEGAKDLSRNGGKPKKYPEAPQQKKTTQNDSPYTSYKSDEPKEIDAAHLKDVEDCSHPGMIPCYDSAFTPTLHGRSYSDQGRVKTQNKQESQFETQKGFAGFGGKKWIKGKVQRDREQLIPTGSASFKLKGKKLVHLDDANGQEIEENDEKLYDIDLNDERDESDDDEDKIQIREWALNDEDPLGYEDEA